MAYAPSTLLELRDTSASWRAGVGGCRVSVTLLDRVHLVVHGGDCVVIRHADPAAAQLLAVALEGEHRFRHLHARGLVEGARAAHPALRVRRASISPTAVAWLCQGWHAPAVEAALRSSPLHAIAGPVLHLLRASRSIGGRSAHAPARIVRAAEHEAWMTWALQQRVRGGALVILHDGSSGHAPASGFARAPSGHPPVTVREAAGGTSHGAIPVASPTPTQFRLVSGRLVAAGDGA